MFIFPWKIIWDLPQFVFISILIFIYFEGWQHSCKTQSVSNAKKGWMWYCLMKKKLIAIYLWLESIKNFESKEEPKLVWSALKESHKLCQNICLLNVKWYQKNWHLSLSRPKSNFWGLFGSFLGMWYPQTWCKYLTVKYLLISKKN